ncbi:MAG: MFS transporter, partial [Gemmatimonadota bacterium]
MLRRISSLLDTPPEVVALSFARMADALGNSLLIIVLPLYIAQEPSPLLNLPTEFLVGLAISLYGFLFALGQPITGRLSDRTGRRKPFILGGLALMAVATGGLMLAHRFLWIFLLRGLQGLGVALIVPAVMALITTSTTTRMRGHAMGVYTTFRMAGFAMGPLLGGVIQVHLGFEAVFLVGGAFLVVAFVLVHLTVDEPSDPRVASATRVRDRASESRSFLPSPSILALMFATVVLASSLSMISALENEFNARLSQTAIGFGIAFSSLTVSRLFVQIPIGRWSDRIGRKKLIVGGLLALAPLTVLFGFVETTLQLVVLRLVQ